MRHEDPRQVELFQMNPCVTTDGCDLRVLWFEGGNNDYKKKSDCGTWSTSMPPFAPVGGNWSRKPPPIVEAVCLSRACCLPTVSRLFTGKPPHTHPHMKVRLRPCYPCCIGRTRAALGITHLRLISPFFTLPSPTCQPCLSPSLCVEQPPSPVLPTLCVCPWHGSSQRSEAPFLGDPFRNNQHDQRAQAPQVSAPALRPA